MWPSLQRNLTAALEKMQSTNKCHTHTHTQCVGNQMKHSQDHSHGCALGTSFQKVVDMNCIPSTNSAHHSRELSTNMLTLHSSAYATPVVVQCNYDPSPPPPPPPRKVSAQATHRHCTQTLHPKSSLAMWDQSLCNLEWQSHWNLVWSECQPTHSSQWCDRYTQSLTVHHVAYPTSRPTPAYCAIWNGCKGVWATPDQDWGSMGWPAGPGGRG